MRPRGALESRTEGGGASTVAERRATPPPIDRRSVEHGAVHVASPAADGQLTPLVNPNGPVYIIQDDWFGPCEGTTMPPVTITELKAHISEYLRRAQAGEHFYVTSRGVDVAEIGPPDPERAALLRMVADGEAEWTGEDMVLPEKLIPNPGRMVSDIVLEDRGPY